jgi:radical SAM protein with 4Fe4S-binding SPASM domain
MRYNLECASWETTLKCNLKCFHCEFSAGKALPNELSTDEALNLCEDLRKVGCKRIILMGGEPFLRNDWELIAKKIKDEGMELAFISNGYLNNEKLFKKLDELSPVFVGVSIDGGKPEIHDKIRGVKGSFNRALNFVDRCLELNLWVIIITSVHKVNKDKLSILRDILYNRNVYWELQITDVAGRFPKKYLVSEDEFYSIGRFIYETQKKHPRGKKFINGAHDMGYYSKIFPNLTGFPEWKGCQAGISLIAIESNGGIKGCSALTTKFVEDNIRNRNIVEIWNDNTMFPYNRQFKIDDLKGYCKNCKYGKNCKGGCLETSYMSTGKTYCDPYCFYKLEKNIEKKIKF